MSRAVPVDMFEDMAAERFAYALTGMKVESPSTLDESPRQSPVPGAGHGAALHLCFTQSRLISGEFRAVPEEGLLLGRGEPLFARTPLDDRRISRRHARIGYRQGSWELEDLQSHNGAYLNGKALQGRAALEWGDVIRIGDTLLVFTQALPRFPEGAPGSEPELVGQGPAILQVRRSIQQVAGHGHSVLILGETGAGKEEVARALHSQSRRPGSIVAINCGSVPASTLDSELFGHARGAFTGAVSSHEGLFRAADRGTLFLDELGEMPAALQVKLLRALETRRIRPLGSASEIAVDVRVVAATHRDIVTAVSEGRFRADLYARLAQWIITVPPLRERREDIAPLARHLLARLGASERQLETWLAEALLLHNWPLNVRGLFNVLSMAVVASGGGRLTLDAQVKQALEAEVRIAPTGRPEPPLAEPPSPEQRPRTDAPSRGSDSLPTAQELETLLVAQRGNIAEVARLLGCSRQQVYRWIEQFGIALERFRGGGLPPR